MMPPNALRGRRGHCEKPLAYKRQRHRQFAHLMMACCHQTPQMVESGIGVIQVVVAETLLDLIQVDTPGRNSDDE